MDILCALSGLVDLERHKKGITDIMSAGFEGILLDAAMCCPAYEPESVGMRRDSKSRGLASKETKAKQRLKVSEHPEELYNSLKPLLEQCSQGHLAAPIARAPYLNRLLERLAEESIRACGQAGCRYLVIRPLFAGIEHGGEWEANREYYLGLADMAKQNNVMILLENQCRNLNGHLVRGICADAGEAAAWVDGLNAERSVSASAWIRGCAACAGRT